MKFGTGGDAKLIIYFAQPNIKLDNHKIGRREEEQEQYKFIIQAELRIQHCFSNVITFYRDTYIYFLISSVSHFVIIDVVFAPQSNVKFVDK